MGKSTQKGPGGHPTRNGTTNPSGKGRTPQPPPKGK